MKKIEFTTEYLDKIISPNETHSVEEYLNAISKLRQIMVDLKMDYHTPDFYPAIEEYKNYATANSHIGRISYCTNYVIEQSLNILQSDKNIAEENLKNIWHELISSFDYSPDYDINIYDVCLFKQALDVFERALQYLANSK